MTAKKSDQIDACMHELVRVYVFERPTGRLACDLDDIGAGLPEAARDDLILAMHAVHELDGENFREAYRALARARVTVALRE